MQHLKPSLTKQKLTSVCACATIVWAFIGVQVAYGQDSSSRDQSRVGGNAPLFVSDSNTGYIDNAIIQTKFQMRFDSGTDIQAPDRAEFFYGACGCARDLGLNPNAPGPTGKVDPSLGVVFSELIETDLDYQELRLDYEHALHKRFSLFVEVPMRFVDGDAIGSHEGVGDVRAGFKWALIDHPSHRLTFQMRSYIPTGDSEKGLGTDHYSLEPGLLYFGRLNEHWTAAAELRYWRPTGGTSGKGTGFTEDFDGEVVRSGLGVGYDFRVSDETTVTPVLEVVSWIVMGGLNIVTVDGTPSTTSYREAEGDTITNVKLGVRVNIGNQYSLYLGYGKPVTEKEWYDDIIRAEFRTSF